MPILAGVSAADNTLADLISETKRHLSSYERPAMNKLADPVSALQTTLTFQFDSAMIQAGTYLELGLELVYVWSVEANRSVTVERAQLGSKASAHAAGTVVTLNPKFPSFAIAKAINDELRALSSPAHGLYAVRQEDLVGTANSSGYDLPGAELLMEILDIRVKHVGSPRTWMPVTNYNLDRSVSATDFPSGLALTLHEGVRPGATLRVLYKTSFGTLVLLTDDATDVAGLPPEMHDLPPLGAAMRLVAPREIKRNFYEDAGDSRRAQEVPPGASSSSIRMIAALRDQRINAEAARLAQLYPERTYIPTPAAVWW